MKYYPSYPYIDDDGYLVGGSIPTVVGCENEPEDDFFIPDEQYIFNTKTFLIKKVTPETQSIDTVYDDEEDAYDNFVEAMYATLEHYKDLPAMLESHLLSMKTNFNRSYKPFQVEAGQKKIEQIYPEYLI